MNFKKLIGAGLIAAATLTGLGDTADAKTRMKLHSAWGQNLPILGTGAHGLADKINTMSGNELAVKVFEPGALVGGTKYYDAVSQGSIDAGFGVSGYHVGKNPAYAFFSSVPFGPGAGEFLAWMRYGGGLEIAEEMFARDNIKYLVCGVIPPETSGWFKKPINSVEDLKGLKMRFFGLGAKVMEKFGVSTQLLAGGDIYPALELGTIDATEFSMPVVDKNIGFYQVAKHNYFPGWHQQTTLLELLVNMDKWKKLSKAEQAIITTSCEAQTANTFAEGEATQFSAMLESQEKGVTIHRWSDEMIGHFEKAWKEVIAEEIADSEDSKRIWKSYSDFRENYKVWRKNGYLQ
ncbi:TRAP transporter substrate-binding protein [Terasakiella sp. SH-1]|uniref:TRAP transporter substrate-binding protein n=1 Tax=Terasakiella sp. SH-1 TaxID=2560057 RepID=UPI00107474A9|nr:TRAP transporter substrate-binding protein [Terasakiella sp. SH-1]